MGSHTLHRTPRRRRPTRLGLIMALVWVLLIAGIAAALLAGVPADTQQCVTVGATSLHCTR